ncbi:hypothetical protein [Corynebacterium aquatimens]|uniref:hypothetical protein n=1 Tax=Corynebacterium aquatimens TaxID=1190508 RepID=UPI003313F087
MTHASDVYSAGILLFELLTGRTPFTGETQLAKAYARLTADVPAPSALIAGVPKLFDELVATATARRPEDRFRDATEFLHALNDVADALALPEYTVPVPRNSAANRAAAHPTNFGVLGASAPAASAEPAPTQSPSRSAEAQRFEPRRAEPTQTRYAEPVQPRPYAQPVEPRPYAEPVQPRVPANVDTHAPAKRKPRRSTL